MEVQDRMKAPDGQNVTVTDVDSFVLTAEGISPWNSERGKRILDEILSNTSRNGPTQPVALASPTTDASGTPLQVSETSRKPICDGMKITYQTLALLSIAVVVMFLMFKAMPHTIHIEQITGAAPSGLPTFPTLSDEDRIALAKLYIARAIDMVSVQYKEHYQIEDIKDDGWDEYNFYDALLTNHSHIEIVDKPEATPDGRKAKMTLRMYGPEMWAKMKFAVSPRISDVYCTGLRPEILAKFVFNAVPVGSNYEFCELEPIEVSLVGKGSCTGLERVGEEKTKAAEEFAVQLYRFYVKYFFKYDFARILGTIVKEAKA